jgi:alkylation response protein AidB-like acyl-CoA dehydrogenase
MWNEPSDSPPRIDTARDVIDALRRMIAGGALALPLPGSGKTDARLEALAEVAAMDLSLARLAEGHSDALAILAEAGVQPRGGMYGVWAAEPPNGALVATASASGWTLRGTKKYCSGALGLDRALVTAKAPDGARLFDVELRHSRIRPVHGSWPAIGMALTESVDVVFDDVVVETAVGDAGFYVSRPGFWHGAVGVAACWYGGGVGAMRMLQARLEPRSSAHQRAHLGAVAATCMAMKASLDAAARDIDADPRNANGAARTRALATRHVVERGCIEVLDRVGRATGSSAMVFDRAHARRVADLSVYLRQHRAEQELEELGSALLKQEASCSP